MMPTRLLSRLADSSLFGKHLLVTNTVISGSLMAVGDSFIQKMERMRMKEPAKHNWFRTGRMLAIGLVMGPVNHGWYFALDKLLIGKSATVITKKILLDQIIASPLFASIFFMGMGTLERKPPQESFEEFRQNFMMVYAMDWVVWPAAQAINFYFLPSQYRVLYVSFITLGWDMFLSAVKHEHQTIHKESIPAPIPTALSLAAASSSSEKMVTEAVSQSQKVNLDTVHILT